MVDWPVLLSSRRHQRRLAAPGRNLEHETPQLLRQGPRAQFGLSAIELLHVKERGLDADPKKRTAYDRLLVGEADQCVEDAVAVVEGIWPGWLPPHVQEALQ